jgi:hypothetical protein
MARDISSSFKAITLREEKSCNLLQSEKWKLQFLCEFFSKAPNLHRQLDLGNGKTRFILIGAEENRSIPCIARWKWTPNCHVFLFPITTLIKVQASLAVNEKHFFQTNPWHFFIALDSQWFHGASVLNTIERRALLALFALCDQM